MADALNYAQQYFQALAQQYPYVLYFGDLYNVSNNTLYKPLQADTIKIPRLTVGGRVDGNRDTISGVARDFVNDWEPKKLEHHRMWKTLVHPVDIDQTNIVASIANITKVFNEEQKFPEMDRYLISKIYDLYTTENKQTADTTVLTTDNILSVVDNIMEKMDEKRVPVAGRIMYVTPKINTMLKNAKEIERRIQNGDTNIVRTVNRIEDLIIKVAPSDIMMTKFDFTKGSTIGAGSQQINLFIIHPTAIITPQIYAFSQLQDPSPMTEGKYVYFEESFEDVFILNNRVNAIAFNATAGGGGN